MITLEDYIAIEKLNGTQVFQLGKMFDTDDGRILLCVKNSILDGHVTLKINSLSMEIRKEYVEIMKNLIKIEMKQNDVAAYENANGSCNFRILEKSPDEYLPFWIELLERMNALEKEYINE